MFEKEIYVQRRRKLRGLVKSGLVLFLGNDESPMNYPANTYHFRQDSSFLYFFGLDAPGLAGVIDLDEEKEFLFGNDVDMDDIIWMGPQPLLRDRARAVGVRETRPLSHLEDLLGVALKQGRPVHFLPPYRPEKMNRIEKLLGICAGNVRDYASRELIKAVVKLRARKSAEEVEEIESALEITAAMYRAARAAIAPGVYEYDVCAHLLKEAQAGSGLTSFPSIVTVHGETLHNHGYANRLKKGDLLLIDSGAESRSHYAADITRTYPVSGTFTTAQKEIYSLVLKMQLEAIAAIKPGLHYREVHLLAARILVQGMKTLGLMKGDPDEAVACGAHALFFPHGLGHMMGLDVHDMEDLGENYVGYDGRVRRSDQFGLAYLRMARQLEPGFVLTVEPGIYFIPALIALWKAEKKNVAFLNFEKIDSFIGLGGVRIEDDVLITRQGCRVLGPGIPKKPAEIARG
jgi:Xaa-Pro aminopeptidase